MLSGITRHGMFPLHERLVGRSTVRYARELEQSQWESPAAIRELQRRKLTALLDHAAANTPYYARQFAVADVRGGDADPMVLLAKLPILDKSEIRRNVRDMVWKDAPGGLHEYNTGGSTGEPLTFYIDRRRQGFDQAARIRTHRWFGVDFGQRELLLWGSPIERARTDRLKALRDRLFNQRLLDAFHLSESHMDAYLDGWDRFRPRAFFGYPSSIARFVEHARVRGRQLDTRELRAVFVTGEVCHSPDRESIEHYFGVPVADGYGSREGGFIAHQCPEGSMHVMAENVVVEIVRDGERRPIGESGEIVLTHLDAWGMPFIRYRTGDVGRLLPGRCACGRGLPLMDVVQGRSTDFLYLPDGDVKHALSIIYPLRAMPGIRRFRVTQEVDYAVTIDVECDPVLNAGNETTSGTPVPHGRGGNAGFGVALGITGEDIVNRVRPVLGMSIPIEVRLNGFIAPVESGKFRYVVSRAAPASRPIDRKVPIFERC